MAQENLKQKVEISVTKDLSTATVDDTKIEFSPNGNVAIYTNQKNLSITRTASTVAPEAGMQVSLVGNFRTVAAYGAKVELAAEGIAAFAPGDIRIFSPSSQNWTSTAIDAALTALAIGQQLKDGTYYIGISPDTKQEMFVPEGIITDEYNFDSQSQGPAKLNKERKHGQTDWDNLSSGELKVLGAAWDKVAPANLRGSSAPWLWSSSSYLYKIGWALKPDSTAQGGVETDSRLAVPAVRRGPARS